ncbi:MAG: DNA polymerase III subunit alpha [Flavobacteriales bacterium]|nr:DNA polymerase III subunit alpha [Flavobacteriales bacterium]
MLLNCHTYYSFHYGAVSPRQLLEIAVRAGAQSVALTDVNSSAACLDFLRHSREFDIHPVVGVDFKLGTQTKYVALARNNEGYKEINKHLSQQLMYGEEIPDRAPQFDNAYVIYPLETLGSLGASSSPLGRLGGAEFIGIRPSELMRLQLSPWLKMKEKLVVLQPMSFRGKSDFNTHRLLRAIDQNCLLSKLPTDQQATEKDTFWSCDMLRDAFAEFPHIVQNTERILQDCKVNFEFGNYAVSNNQRHFLGSFQEDKERLEQLCNDKLKYRYPNANRTVFERLQKELDIIEQKKFFSYFLINHDIVNYAKRQGYFHIGRGSGANSMVAYIIGITDVDPIELDLYFERFINPSRKNPPDFDIDFSWTDRQDVTRYIFERYPKAALQGSYSTFKDRSVNRELGKVLGLPAEEIDRLNSRYLDVNSLDHLSKLVLKYGFRIQSFPNHTTVHSSGILIPELDIHSYSATFLPPKGFPTTQFDMHVAEDVGLHKFDILGQRGLGKIKDSIGIIKENRGVEVDVHDIPKFKEDAAIKKLLKHGKTVGAFYVESPAMRMLLTKLKAEDYNRLVAASSIIRPGVSKSGMMREYILRFQDEERRKAAEAELPEMYAILHDTFGVMVYQEDVLKVAHIFADLTLEEADILRRGMSWKFRERNEFGKIKDQFFNNCIAKGHPQETIQKIWEQILSFGNFAFAKGHSASYAVESFQALFLKAHYPLEYMVATVNNGGGFYSQELYLHEAKMHGAIINLPCVNRSDSGASIYGKDIFIGLGMIAGFETETMNQLLIERYRNGAFRDLRDVVKRVPISLEQLRILIRIGALRFTGLDKKALLWDAHFLLGHTKISRPERKLFDAEVKEFQLPELWYHELENAYDEMELLGFPVTISPFDLIDRRGLPTTTAAEIHQRVNETVEIIGYRVHIRGTHTSNGKYMTFGNLIDLEGQWINSVQFPNVATRYPFRGPGIYKLRGKVTEEFGHISLETTYVERIPNINIETPNTRVADSAIGAPTPPNPKQRNQILN